MKNGLMLAAFAVLLFGVAFADMAGASAVAGTPGKYVDPGTAASVITEGGNVTDVNVSANASTEKWAGFYGNVTGNLLLSKGVGGALYIWPWAPTAGGTVCVSTASAFTWGALVAAVAGNIDTAWSFATTDADSATNTLTNTCSLYINPQGAVTGVGKFTKNNAGADFWETCAVTDGAGTGKTNTAFCVNITSGTAAPGTAALYQLMAPTPEAANTTETYYFYLELR